MKARLVTTSIILCFSQAVYALNFEKCQPLDSRDANAVVKFDSKGKTLVDQKHSSYRAMALGEKSDKIDYVIRESGQEHKESLYIYKDHGIPTHYIKARPAGVKGTEMSEHRIKFDASGVCRKEMVVSWEQRGSKISNAVVEQDDDLCQEVSEVMFRAEQSGANLQQCNTMMSSLASAIQEKQEAYKKLSVTVPGSSRPQKVNAAMAVPGFEPSFRVDTNSVYGVMAVASSCLDPKTGRPRIKENPIQRPAGPPNNSGKSIW